MSRYFLTIFFLISLIVVPACSVRGRDASNNQANQNNTDFAAQFTDARAALTEGARLLDAGDTERAIEVLNRSVELDPDLAEAYFKLGIAYSLIETRDAAIVEEQITPTPLPGDPKPKPKKTNSEIAFEKAIAAYKKLIESDPENDAAYYDLGRSYNKLNQDEEAERAFRQAVKLKPDDTEYQTDLGAILVKLAKYREAIGPLNKAVELDPENSRAANLLDDAEAGRRRIDFTPPKKGVSNSENANSESNSNSSESNTDSTPKPTPKEENFQKQSKQTPSAKRPN